MGRRHASFSFLFIFLLVHLFSATSPAPPSRNSTRQNKPVVQLPPDDVTVSPPRNWSTANTAAMITNNTAGWSLQPLLLQSNSGPTFACGLLCLRHDGAGNSTNPCNGSTILFGVFLVVGTGNNSVATNSSPPVPVWSVNRNYPITHPATLRFTETGLLQLDSGNGSSVWLRENVSYINLTYQGRLKLFYSSRNGSSVEWPSLDYPTNTALIGQSLSGKQLVANSSKSDGRTGQYLLNITDKTFTAYVQVQVGGFWELQIYYTSDISNGTFLPDKPSKATDDPTMLVRPDKSFKPTDYPTMFVRLDTDGHLRFYKWSDKNLWEISDEWSWIKQDYRGLCMYPMVCGEYGYCTKDECSSCPRLPGTNFSYFEYKDFDITREGCKAKTPLQPCHPGQQILVDHGNIAFYGYAGPADIQDTDVDNCKRACERNCSCKGAFFKYSTTNLSNGDCYLPSVILTFTKNNWTLSNYNSSAFLKVSNTSRDSPEPNASRDSPQPKRAGRNMVPIAAGVIASCVALLGIACMVFVVIRRRLQYDHQQEELEGREFEFAHLPGMPTRFTYEDLRSATTNFSRKLGEGGFGGVFHGTLSDGMEIAVKVLGYNGQGMKEFLAEVETIGSIHHVNLVRLIGYCADRLHRLLVYEFLSNGSLERWIFGVEGGIDWPTKCKIIADVARGLSYLHEDCRHRIIHLDIKPQNILLDDKFNAKVSDFGLSKLVDRDQSQVVTTLRGTPGYMAPEWLSSMITEKVDVYSFGVVVLEMVSGKRIMDNSRPQGSLNLLSHLRKLAQEDRLLDILAEDCKGKEEEALRMAKIAVWCLQGDCNKRPSMSVVTKVLERVLEVEENLDYNFWVPSWVATNQATSSSTPFLPSLLSGPR